MLKERTSDIQQKKLAQRKREAEAAERERLARGKVPRPANPVSKPRLTATEKGAADRKLRTYTVLDYLYRLRVNTDCEDAAMFLDGPDDDLSSSRVHRDLVTLASSTMLMHELHIGALIGRATLLKWADGWLERNGVSAALGAGLRRDIVAARLVR